MTQAQKDQILVQLEEFARSQLAEYDLFDDQLLQVGFNFKGDVLNKILHFLRCLFVNCGFEEAEAERQAVAQRRREELFREAEEKRKSNELEAKRR